MYTDYRLGEAEKRAEVSKASDARLLNGMLGSSILGFHTQFHCNNFVDTVDRQLEARVDRETFTVSYRCKMTAVKRFPISIEWPPSPALMEKPVAQCRVDVRQRHGLPENHAIGVGADRFDYTTGIACGRLPHGSTCGLGLTRSRP